MLFSTDMGLMDLVHKDYIFYTESRPVQQQNLSDQAWRKPISAEDQFDQIIKKYLDQDMICLLKDRTLQFTKIIYIKKCLFFFQSMECE